VGEGKKSGTIIVELSLDATKYTSAQKEILDAAKKNSADIEKTFGRVGITSDKMYDAMKKNIQNSLTAIKQSHLTTADEKVRAEQSAADKIRRINEQQYGVQTSLIGKMKQNWLGLAAVVTAAFYAMRGAMDVLKDVTLTSARMETMGIVMRVVGRNAGYSGAEMEEFARSLEKTGISMLSARQSLSMMARAQLDLTKSTELGRIAQDAAVIANMNSSKAFEQMIYGIQAANVRVLRTMGINVQFGESYARVAKEMGRTVASLSEVEKATIRTNEVIEAGRMIAGTYEASMQTAGKQLLTLERHFENLKVLAGAAFTPALAEIVEEITRSVTGLNGELDDNMDVIHEWGVRFRLTIISIEAEVMRLSMFIDKVGGTLTTLKTLAGGVTDFVQGVFGGKGTAYQDALAQNDALRKRYEATEKQLQALADKYVALEDSISPAGKAAAKAAKDAADAVKGIAVNAGEGAKEVTDEQKHLREQWKETKRTLEAKIEGEGVDRFTKRLIAIRVEAEKLVEKFKQVPGAAAVISKWREGAEGGVEGERAAESLKFERKAQAERERGIKEWQKIVTSAQVWEMDKMQLIINKRLALEETAVARVYELWEAGTINLAQLDEGLAAVRGASARALEAEMMMVMEEELSIYKDLAGFEETYYEKKLSFLDMEIDALQMKYNLEKNITDAMREQAGNAIADAATEKRMDDILKKTSGYADMLDAISGLYDENSKQAKLAHDAASVASVIQQGLLLKEAIAAATVAVATQGKGDPYTAFARVAAMIALMASVLSQAGISFGGGGGGASASALPPSTVLGAEAGTGSESVSKVWDLLQDTYDLEYRELTGIHNSVKQLNTNITGLVTSIVRTGSVEMAGVTLKNTATMFGTYGEDKLYGGVAGAIEDFGNWVLNTVVGGIFGGGKKQTLEASGIESKGVTAGQLIAGEYMDVLQYSVIKTVKDGGWFHSDKTSYQTLYESLDADVSRLFNLVFQGMSRTLVDIATGLGVDVNRVLEYTFEGSQLDLKGKTGEEIQKALSEYFSKVGDEAVEALFGDLVSKYQQLNEGLFETAARLAVDKAVVTEILKMTEQGFPGATAAVIAFSESIIELAGGLDELQESAATYYDKFFTDAEKQTRLQEQLSGALEDVNLFLPSTRDGYRAIVEALDLSTDAGREAYVALLKWSGAADEYYSVVEDAADGTKKLTESLLDQKKMITDWIASMTISSLAPVTSREAWVAEYERQKATVSAPGATTKDLSSFLSVSKEYLQFMRAYGGDYQAVFDAVMGDVQQLGDIKDAQIMAIEAADAAARDAAERQLLATTAIVAGMSGTGSTGTSIYDTLPNPYGYPASYDYTSDPNWAEDTNSGAYPWLAHYAHGGLTYGPSIAGESGKEWIVPTYEPQRSRFLESAPPQFWENLRGAGVVQPGGGGDITVRVPVYLDGKVVADVVAKNIKSNTNLSDAIRRVN